jgi:signal transduction histidine kinase
MIERIDLRAFVAETLELLGSVMPDEIIFTCRFGDTPDVDVDPSELREVITKLVINACKAFDDGAGEVQLRVDTVSGKSGPHAFVEVSRPASGARITIPLPTVRPRTMRLAEISRGGTPGSPADPLLAGGVSGSTGTEPA